MDKKHKNEYNLRKESVGVISLTPITIIKKDQEVKPTKIVLSAMDIRRKYGVTPRSSKMLVDLHREGK